MYEEKSDLPSSRRSDNHDQFINESSSSLINSSSESEDETHEQDSNVYTSQRAKIPLFENSEFTVLQTLAGYFQWFTEHPSISKSALSGILRLKKRLLPQPNNLPGTYEEACNFVKPFLLPFETYHVCPNDCVLFRKTTRYDYSKLVSCPVCGTKRYSANKKARRTFMYYPLGPRCMEAQPFQNFCRIISMATKNKTLCMTFTIHPRGKKHFRNVSSILCISLQT